jgi:TolB-like protein/Flp pilus assembly protein TadD
MLRTLDSDLGHNSLTNQSELDGEPSIRGNQRAVFLSYASEDADAAQRICASLRSAGIEVWFDQSELRGGDSWDAMIRKQIKACALFMPIISAHTRARPEGYFRLEWKLAVDRSHLMAAEMPFLLPVVVDGTRETDALVPDKFREVQWMRLPGGDTPAASVERIARLLSADRKAAATPVPARDLAPGPDDRRVRNLPKSDEAAKRAVPWRSGTAVLLTLVALAIGYFVVDRLAPSKRISVSERAAAPAGPSTAPAQSAIAEDSIAVLPFLDLSEKKDQEYFSDGLSEELLDLLAKTPGLEVIARTSSFYFKGKQATIAEIASTLHVAHVLEGSVRKAGNTMRVTAQLIRASDGVHLWSETYDREFKDVFKVQDEIASAVVGALKLKLLTTPATKNRQTANTEAYTQYLIGRQILLQENWSADARAAAAFRKAIALDPNYATAWADLADALDGAAEEAPTRELFKAGKQESLTAAEKAVALRPDLSDGFAIRGYLRAWRQWDFAAAEADFRRALTLDPDSPEVHASYARSVLLPTGRFEEARAAAVRLTNADPLNAQGWRLLGIAETRLGHADAGRAALLRSLEISPEQSNTAAAIAFSFLRDGKPTEALNIAPRSTSEVFRLTATAMAYHDLGRDPESQRLLDELIARHHEFAAYQIAEVFAWRADIDHAFEWLDKAYDQDDGGLTQVRGDPMLLRLHADPRFAAILKRMNLPL